MNEEARSLTDQMNLAFHKLHEQGYDPGRYTLWVHPVSFEKLRASTVLGYRLIDDENWDDLPRYNGMAVRTHAFVPQELALPLPDWVEMRGPVGWVPFKRISA